MTALRSLDTFDGQRELLRLRGNIGDSEVREGTALLNVVGNSVSVKKVNDLRSAYGKVDVFRDVAGYLKGYRRIQLRFNPANYRTT